MNDTRASKDATWEAFSNNFNSSSSTRLVPFFSFDPHFIFVSLTMHFNAPTVRGKEWQKIYFYLRETKMHHIFHEFINCTKQALARNMQQTEVAVTGKWKFNEKWQLLRIWLTFCFENKFGFKNTSLSTKLL